MYCKPQTKIAPSFSGSKKMFPTASPNDLDVQARGKPQGGATEFQGAKLGGTSGGDRRETYGDRGFMRFIQTTGEFNKCIGFFREGAGFKLFFSLPFNEL